MDAPIEQWIGICESKEKRRRADVGMQFMQMGIKIYHGKQNSELHNELEMELFVNVNGLFSSRE